MRRAGVRVACMRTEFDCLAAPAIASSWIKYVAVALSDGHRCASKTKPHGFCESAFSTCPARAPLRQVPGELLPAAWKP
eukprot:5937917-Pleurochrysis_carterae.AAC.1